MEQVIIRTAIPDDLPTLLGFEQGIIATERPFDCTLKDGTISYYDIKQMIGDDDIEVAVAVLNNTLIASGYVRIETSKPYLKHVKHAYLGFMYVVPEHRGKGMNNRIIAFLKAWAHTRNITELRLDVYVQNEAAIKAYEKIGFAKHLIEMRMAVK